MKKTHRKLICFGYRDVKVRLRNFQAAVAFLEELKHQQKVQQEISPPLVASLMLSQLLQQCQPPASWGWGWCWVQELPIQHKATTLCGKECSPETADLFRSRWWLLATSAALHSRGRRQKCIVLFFQAVKLLCMTEHSAMPHYGLSSVPYPCLNPTRKVTVW